jgi:hypothetical protein
VSAIEVAIQCLEILHNACPNRIKVNVPYQLFKIGIFLANNGFVTVLKELPGTLMTAIKADDIAR